MLLTDVDNNNNIMRPYKNHDAPFYVTMLYSIPAPGSLLRMEDTLRRVTDYRLLYSRATGESTSEEFYKDLVE